MAKGPQSDSDVFGIPGEFDLRKLMDNFKVSGVEVETLLESQRRNLEALTQANKLALEGMQALIKRQSEILRQTVEEGAVMTKELGQVEVPQDRAVRHTELIKQAFERAVANSRELSEIVAKSSGEAFELLNKRFAAGLDEMRDGIAKSKK